MLVACARLLPAQSSAHEATPLAVTAYIRVVVFDSLAQAPLPGAHVWTSPEQNATADSAARFLLREVPADGQPVPLSASHTAIDSIGRSALAVRVRVRVAAGDTSDTSEVTLAVPSYHTLHAAACAGIAEAGEEGVTLFGSIRAAAAEAVAPSASVQLRWRSVRSRGDRRLQEVLQAGVDAMAGADGSYSPVGDPPRPTRSCAPAATRPRGMRRRPTDSRSPLARGASCGAPCGGGH